MLKRNKILKVGVCGCGAIGSSLARFILEEFSGEMQLSGLYDLDAGRAKNLARELKKEGLALNSLESLIKKAGLVIETSRAESAFRIAQETLSRGRDILLMSVGGVINTYRELESLARKNNARIFIPSGAICGIDGLKASAAAEIRRVTLTTKKPPRAFSGVAYVSRLKIDLENLKQDTLIFEGSALEAVSAFPQNINVAATLSLAGIGPEKTRVRVVASPAISRNIHEIEIESDAGRIFTATENLIHPDNPKTSYLAVLSAIASLKQIVQPVKIGT